MDALSNKQSALDIITELITRLDEQLPSYKKANYNETIRGKKVFIIQSTTTPAENIMELLMLVDAARRASADKIIAVIPYFGYARQDRKDKPRTSIGAKLMANVLTAAGVDRLITMDLHADQIQGFFEFPVDHLYASTVFFPFILQQKIDDVCMVSPDTGGTKRVVSYSKKLGCDFAIAYKQRAKACLLYTSDADDDLLCVDLGGRRIFKKKN